MHSNPQSWKRKGGCRRTTSKSKKAVLGTILADPDEALLAAEEFGLDKADFYLIGANGFIEGEWL